MASISVFLYIYLELWGTVLWWGAGEKEGLPKCPMCGHRTTQSPDNPLLWCHYLLALWAKLTAGR